MHPVVIAGGGPAGAASALTLARRGVRCRVLEAAPAARRKVGETIPPNAAPLLSALGVDAGLEEPRHLICHGNRYLWGSGETREKHFLLQPQGHGWHLDRAAFERQLADEAVRRGVEWWSGCRLLAAERRQRGGWRLTVHRRGEAQRLRTPFLVDAAGRASPLARSLGVERAHYDRQLGLACVLRLAPDHGVPHHAHVEAVPDGWWYAAPIPGGRLMSIFMTDADLLDRRLLKAAAFRRAARRTHLIGPLVKATEDPRAPEDVVARVAASSRLARACGDGWLAVGDAAFAYDPVSSYGLTSALGGGFFAGNAIADHLGGRPEAMPAYVEVVEEGYRLYLEMLRNQYRLERRWPESPFWRRRHREAFTQEVQESRMAEQRGNRSHPPNLTGKRQQS